MIWFKKKRSASLYLKQRKLNLSNIPLHDMKKGIDEKFNQMNDPEIATRILKESLYPLNQMHSRIKK